MSTDTPDSLPPSVPVPPWGDRSDRVEIACGDGKISGTLYLSTTASTVYVEGSLTYRGQTYEVRYQHTTDEGNPLGYYYAADGSGQVHGELPGPGIADWARADFFTPRAPKTFVEPLLARVKWAVQQYQTTFAHHAAQSRANSLRQELYRKADSYNTKAKEAAEALVEYKTMLVTYDAALVTLMTTPR